MSPTRRRLSQPRRSVCRLMINSTNRNSTYDLLLNFHAEPATTQSLPQLNAASAATLLALSWPCHRCSHWNDSSRNKKRCSSCQALRDGLAPLSAKGGTSTLGAAASSDAGLVGDDATCHNKNGLPNNVSPCRDGSPTKRGKRENLPLKD
jgi:hypothetical protein